MDQIESGADERVEDIVKGLNLLTTSLLLGGADNSTMDVKSDLSLGNREC